MFHVDKQIKKLIINKQIYKPIGSKLSPLFYSFPMHCEFVYCTKACCPCIKTDQCENWQNDLIVLTQYMKE